MNVSESAVLNMQIEHLSGVYYRHTAAEREKEIMQYSLLSFSVAGSQYMQKGVRLFITENF